MRVVKGSLSLDSFGFRPDDIFGSDRGFSAFDVVLLNGMPVASDEIQFNPTTYHFTTVDGADITDLISRADKMQLVPNFDITKDNYRLSNESYRNRPAPYTDLTGGSTAILGPALTGIASDIASGGGRVVSGIGQGVKDTVQTVIIFGIAGIVAYFLLGGKIKL